MDLIHCDHVPGIVKIKHACGFFSCCSVRLHCIVDHCNRYNMIPQFIDTSEMFTMYKQYNIDLTFEFFN